MMRDQFSQVPRIHINSLLLDERNPRIGNGKDQVECLNRIADFGETFFNLVRDIAERGITIEPIVIYPSGNQYIVKDGNRRIAAIKLLHNYDLCEKPAYRQKLQALAELAEQNGNLLEVVDCYLSDSLDAINDYIWRSHTGENGGVGHKDWDTLQQEIFLLSVGKQGQHWKAAKLALWAADNGIEVKQDIPLTTISRYFRSAKNIKLLGFSFQGDEIVPHVDPVLAVKIARRLLKDAQDKVINVSRNKEGSIFLAGDQEHYINRIRAEFGLNAEQHHSGDGKEGASGNASPGTYGASPGGATGGNANPGDRKSDEDSPEPGASDKGTGTVPKVHSTNRTKYVSRTTHPIRLPTGKTKIRDVYVELTKVEDCPTAAMMLVRVFLELTLRGYLGSHGIISDQHKLKNTPLKDMLNAVRLDLIDKGKISQNSDLDLVISKISKDEIVSINSMQKYVHSENFHPDNSNVNTMWSELYDFLKLCHDN
jgi:hypothetical protein